MTADLRKQNLEAFVESKTYLTGMRYRVVVNEAQDLIYIEFEKLGEDLYDRLRVDLKTAMMRHVQVKVQKVLPAERRSEHKKRNKSRSYDQR